MNDEMICEEMQGMILVHNTGKTESKFWVNDAEHNLPFQIPTHARWSIILRSIYRLAYRSGSDWELSDYWGAVWDIVEDDGRAIVAYRSFHDNSSQAIIFATSMHFWTKIILKYR